MIFSFSGSAQSGGLLNRDGLGSSFVVLLSRDFFAALVVCRPLTCGDLIEGAPLRLHPHVGVGRQHGPRDVTGDAHDHFVAGTRLREFRDWGVAVVVPSSDDFRVVADLGPRCPQRRNRTGRICPQRGKRAKEYR